MATFYNSHKPRFLLFSFLWFFLLLFASFNRISIVVLCLVLLLLFYNGLTYTLDTHTMCNIINTNENPKSMNGLIYIKLRSCVHLEKLKKIPKKYVYIKRKCREIDDIINDITTLWSSYSMSYFCFNALSISFQLSRLKLRLIEFFG